MNKKLLKAKIICWKKKGFVRLNDAQKAVEKMRERGGHHYMLHAYLCSHCKMWHIGHKPEPKPKPLSQAVLVDLVRNLQSTDIDVVFTVLRQREYSISKIELGNMLVELSDGD